MRIRTHSVNFNTHYSHQQIASNDENVDDDQMELYKFRQFFLLHLLLLSLLRQGLRVLFDVVQAVAVTTVATCSLPPPARARYTHLLFSMFSMNYWICLYSRKSYAAKQQIGQNERTNETERMGKSSKIDKTMTKNKNKNKIIEVNKKVVCAVRLGLNWIGLVCAIARAQVSDVKGIYKLRRTERGTHKKKKKLSENILLVFILLYYFFRYISTLESIHIFFSRAHSTTSTTTTRAACDGSPCFSFIIFAFQRAAACCTENDVFFFFFFPFAALETRVLPFFSSFFIWISKKHFMSTEYL